MTYVVGKLVQSWLSWGVSGRVADEVVGSGRVVGLVSWAVRNWICDYQFDNLSG